jgi:hypothetical protein
MVATTLTFALTLLFVSSSPLTNLSMKWAIQGWATFFFYAMAATLLLGGIFDGIALALKSRDA